MLTLRQGACTTGSQNGDHFQVEESEANAGSNEETRKPDVEQGHGHGPGTDVVSHRHCPPMHSLPLCSSYAKP